VATRVIRMSAIATGTDREREEPGQQADEKAHVLAILRLPM